MLENLACTGEEATLLDCPLFGAGVGDDAPSPADYVYYYGSTIHEGFDTCDHFSEAGRFARVACGMADAAGAHQPGLLQPIARFHSLHPDA